MMETTRVRIEVTREHIDRGEKGHCSTCPIALAIRGILKPKIAYKVGVVDLYLNENVTPRLLFLPGHLIPLPDVAKTFLRHFDEGLPVEPFAFDIHIPTEYLREGVAL